jgi:hypothetical protein
MWDNRASKRNPRAPDFKCRDKGCDGVIWPPREGAAPGAAGAPAATATPSGEAGDPPCPVCGGKMWDDRASKRNPRAPDFKCRNKPKFQGGPGCPGVIWPPRDGERRPAPAAAPRSAAPRSTAPSARQAPAAPPAAEPFREFGDDEFPGEDDLPF